MKAVVLKGIRQIEMVDAPKPEPKEDEAIIKVRAVGVCGSDIRYFLGENPWALHTLGKNIKETKSFILGHEISGDIVEVGKRVSRDRIGERTGIIAFKGCGECYYCRRNLPNLCAKTLHIGHDGRWKDTEYPPGGYAEYMQVWSDKAHPIPENISYEEATQLDGLAVAVHANKVANVSPGDTVLVMGTSAIGLMILQVAKARGAAKIIAVDNWDLPLSLAKELGADHVLNASETDIVEEVKRITGGIGVNVCFDTVGKSETIKKGLKSLAGTGRLVMLAVTQARITLSLTDLSAEKSITSSANNQYEDYPVAVDLLANGRVKVKPFITHTMKLTEFREAFNMLMEKEKHDAIKIILKP